MGATQVGPGPLLTTEDVARLLGVSEKLIHNWRYEGRGPRFVKLGHRTVRYRPEDVDSWIERQARRPA